MQVEPSAPNNPNQTEARVTASQPLLVSHAVLVGLTPLIPVPFVDDIVKGALERRLVRQVASGHGVTLEDSAVSALVDDEGGVFGGIAKGVVTYPLKLIFRKIFFVLEIKRASDAASLAYHRAYLVDRALARRLMHPLGAQSPAQIRKAIDGACNEVSISPLAQALSSVFSTSSGSLEVLGKKLLSMVKGLPRRRDGAAPGDKSAVDEGVNQAASAVDGGLVDRVRAALDSVPAEHFAELERAFERNL